MIQLAIELDQDILSQSVSRHRIQGVGGMSRRRLDKEAQSLHDKCSYPKH